MTGARYGQMACPCESGLSQARCCALDLASLGAPEANRHLLPLEQRAVRAHQQGAPLAERLAIDVLELAPGLLGALSVLYDIRKKQNNAKAVPALLRRIVALAPNTIWATHEMVAMLLARGDVLEAERHARNGIRIAPESAQSHYLMGLVMTEEFRPAVGEFHFERALELSNGRQPVVLLNYALCLKNQGKMQAARSLYQEILQSDPNNLPAYLGFARLEEADRNLDAALALLDRAETVAPSNPHVKLLRAIVLGRQKKPDEALAILDTMADDNGRLGPNEWLERGRLLDQIGRYDEAFAAFVEGKKLLREISGQSYLAKYAQQNVARLKSFFVSGRLRMLPSARVRRDVPQPIFIVGFPRSGTTLLEQMLSAHPRISAGDELPIIHELTNLMPRVLDSPLAYPEALAELWMADHRFDLDRLRDHYLQKAEQLGAIEEGAVWFTDKMPLNETHLGLIALLFPRSPILHLTRHPLDVVLSVFSNLLTHGHYCSYALESAAQHYALTMELVEHYRTEVSMRYLAIRYEDLVDHQEETVRRVLDFVGEDFNPGCLAFHENKRYARTASYAQVSQRLYATSRFRYLNYREPFAQVTPLLRPWIEKLGYEL